MQHTQEVFWEDIYNDQGKFCGELKIDTWRTSHKYTALGTHGENRRLGDFETRSEAINALLVNGPRPNK